MKCFITAIFPIIIISNLFCYGSFFKNTTVLSATEPFINIQVADTVFSLCDDISQTQLPDDKNNLLA